MNYSRTVLHEILLLQSFPLFLSCGRERLAIHNKSTAIAPKNCHFVTVSIIVFIEVIT